MTTPFRVSCPTAGDLPPAHQLRVWATDERHVVLQFPPGALAKPTRTKESVVARLCAALPECSVFDSGGDRTHEWVTVMRVIPTDVVGRDVASAGPQQPVGRARLWPGTSNPSYRYPTRTFTPTTPPCPPVKSLLAPCVPVPPSRPARVEWSRSATMSEAETRLHALLLIELLTALADEAEVEAVADERPLRATAAAA